MRSCLLYAIIFFALACGRQEPQCFTPCGIPVYESESGQCLGVADAEYRGLLALSAVPEFSGRDLCFDMKDITSLAILPADDPSKYTRGGRAMCGVRGLSPFLNIEVHGQWVTGHDFRQSSWTHEIAHAILMVANGCNPKENTHPCWGSVCEPPNQDRGIYDAIEASRDL